MMIAFAMVAAATIPPPVAEAVKGAAGVPGATVELSAYRPSPASCPIESAQVERPYFGSGEVLAHFAGAHCSGAALVHVSVRAAIWIAKKAVRAGEVIEAEQVEKEIHGEVLSALPNGARAAHAINAGQAISAEMLQDAAGPVGGKVSVELVDGALRIGTTGRVVPCSRGKSCAVLPSGKHVEGDFTGGVLVVGVNP
jgi:hypothetical protein